MMKDGRCTQGGNGRGQTSAVFLANKLRQAII